MSDTEINKDASGSKDASGGKEVTNVSEETSKAEANIDDQKKTETVDKMKGLRAKLRTSRGKVTLSLNKIEQACLGRKS